MIFNNIHLVQQSYPLHLPQNYLIHSTLPIFILSTQPYSILTVDMFGSYLTTKNPRAWVQPLTLGNPFISSLFRLLFLNPCYQYHTLNVAKSARLNVLSVILSFLVQGNTFIRLFTFCSFKETRPLFQVECSISMFKKKSPLGLYYCFPVGLLIILYRLCIVLLIATRIIALFSLSS